MPGENHQSAHIPCSGPHGGDIARSYRSKVVVTGVGESTPLGGDVPSTWNAMLQGESGVVRLDEEDQTGLLPPIVGGRARVEPDAGLEHRQRRRLSRTAQFAVTAAAEAWRDAGLDTDEAATGAPRRVAVVVSAALGDMDAIFKGWDALQNRGWRRVPPLTVPMSMGNGAAGAVALLVGAKAGVHATINACSSGTQALAFAAGLIRRGEADVVVSGGAEAPLHPLVLASFAAMRSLSGRVDDPSSTPRPFDAERDGMVLSEGAGILVLESGAHAARRGARVYAELAGVGISSDAYDMVQPQPDGSGTAGAIRTSLADAGVRPEQVAHLNANGTATLPGDAAEARGITAVFGEAARQPVMTATKSMMGHTLGAAGAVEAIATVLALHYGVVPATRNLTRVDDALQLNAVQGTPHKLDSDQNIAVKNSAGFGGHNVALTFRGEDRC